MKNYRPPRCIAINHTRCPRRASKGSGDLFLCARHSTIWLMLLIEDGCSLSTRRMLAFAKWENAKEGRALINKMFGREAA
jgi:hypothetical protein